MSCSDSRTRKASRSVGRETPNCSSRAFSGGSASPSCSSPRTIRRRSSEATSSAVLGTCTLPGMLNSTREASASRVIQPPSSSGEPYREPTALSAYAAQPSSKTWEARHRRTIEQSRPHPRHGLLARTQQRLEGEASPHVPVEGVLPRQPHPPAHLHGGSRRGGVRPHRQAPGGLGSDSLVSTSDRFGSRLLEAGGRTDSDEDV